MKTTRRTRGAWRILTLLSLLTAAQILPCRAVPFAVSFWYPTNGEAFIAPANAGVHALVTDSNVVRTMQYYSGATLLGTVTNAGGVLLTNSSQGSPFFMAWSNVAVGSYVLTALATDSAGHTATSGPVNLTVSNAPPPVIRPATYIYSPTNNATFLAPATLTIYGRAVESGGQVATVKFLANNANLGVVPYSSQAVFTNVSSEPLFPLAWSNVLAGSYALQTIATDTNGNTATSSVVNISVVTNLPPPIVGPSVAIYSPANGTTYTQPATINIYARAVESTGTVATVQFFANSINLGVVTNTSQVVVSNLSSGLLFPITWPNVKAGSYALKAVATDTSGNMATSAVVNVTVVVKSPIPFTVGFAAPTNGQMFAAPANIYLHASVTDSNLIQFVQYFSGTSLLGVISNSTGVLLTNATQSNPFYLTWSNVPAGGYALTAVALDTAGNTATSAPVNITVTNIPPPIIPFAISLPYPTNGQKFAAPANIYLHASVTDSNLVQFVQYFSGTSLLGVVSNSTGVLLTNATQSNPFYLTWSNVPAGVYALTAVALDTAGNTATSAPVSITVTNVPAPYVPFAVGFFYPTNGQVFAAPTNIYLHASVADSNLVQLVEYFSGSAMIGVVSNTIGVRLTNSTQSNPFSMIWSNVLAGSYALTAVAIDTAGNTATSAPVNITVTNIPPPIVPFAVTFFSPTNGQKFAAPASIYLHASVTDSNLVQFVQYFSGNSLIGVVSNLTGVRLTNSTQSNPFYLTWSNVPAGGYALTAVAMDSGGNTATSAPVNITVTNIPPPIIPFAISLPYPTNGQKFAAPANIYLHASVTDSNLVQFIQYFSGNSLIGVVSNLTGVRLTNSTQSNPFYMTWSNVPAGGYALTAVAMDSGGNTATSAPVSISVTNLPAPYVPFAVSFWYPTNGQWFTAPATVGIHARVTDSNLVQFVQYYSGSTLIGTASNYTSTMLTNSTQGNPFFLSWSNVPVGNYSLTAVAVDTAGNTATSGPVAIYVLTNLPPVVSIYAPDPVAIEGTNYANWFTPATSVTNYISGTNTATFLIRRASETNTDLTVYYSIGGTAINGVDYATIPNYAVIPAGQTYALITIVPLPDTDSSYRAYDTVLLSLIVPTNPPPAFAIGSPASAGAIILEENFLPIPQPIIRCLEDNSLHVSLPATNGLNFCLQISTDLVNWLPVCTNTVLKGSAQYVDPGAGAGLYYRIVPVATPASY